MCPWMHCEQLRTVIPWTMLFVSNICIKYAPKLMVSSLIFQKIYGEEHRAPSPNPFPLRLGFALSSGFALNSWALRTFSTLASFPQALDYAQGASQPRFGLAYPQLSISTRFNWFDPKIYSWWIQKASETAMVSAPFGEFLDRLLLID